MECKPHMSVETLASLYRYYIPVDAPDDVKPSLVWVRGYADSTYFRRQIFVQDAGSVVRGYVQYNRELTPEEVSKYGLLPSLYGWRGYIGDDGRPLMPDKKLERLVTRKQLAEDAERQFDTRDVKAALRRADRALREYLFEVGEDPSRYRA